VYAILCLVVGMTTVIVVYFCLNAENYLWQWTAFYSRGVHGALRLPLLHLLLRLQDQHARVGADVLLLRVHAAHQPRHGHPLRHPGSLALGRQQVREEDLPECPQVHLRECVGLDEGYATIASSNDSARSGFVKKAPRDFDRPGLIGGDSGGRTTRMRRAERGLRNGRRVDRRRAPEREMRRRVQLAVMGRGAPTSSTAGSRA